MSEFSDFFVCEEKDLVQAAESACSSKTWPYWGCKWIDHVQLAPLYTLLTGVSKERAAKDLAPDMVEEPAAPPYEERDMNDPEAWLTGWGVTRFPDAFVQALAKIKKADRADVVARWKAELVAGGDRGTDCGFVLDGIVPLAVKAVKSGHRLILSSPAGA